MSITARLDRLAGRISIDWWAFGRTRGAFTVGTYEFFQATPPDGTRHGQTWEPWSTYWPSLPVFEFPPLAARRGPIRFFQ